MGANDGSFSSGSLLSADPGEDQAQSCACVEDICVPWEERSSYYPGGQDALEGCLKSSAERPLVSISAYSGHLSSL